MLARWRIQLRAAAAPHLLEAVWSFFLLLTVAAYASVGSIQCADIYVFLHITASYFAAVLYLPLAKSYIESSMSSLPYIELKLCALHFFFYFRKLFL